MLDTDADRLAELQAVGGRCVLVDGREVLAIFDNGFLETTDAPGVEVRQPFLICRTSDILGIQKDKAVEVGSEVYRVKRHEPDGTGMSHVQLKR